MSRSPAVMPVESNSVAQSCDASRIGSGMRAVGNAGGRPDREPRYPSDMSDAEWAVVRDAMPVPPWLEGRGGRPEGYCHRQMVDGHGPGVLTRLRRGQEGARPLS
ncbi:hypothetical protein GCM10012280_49020 [Wenjunlia tyrosinilytica]|uniref:Transposase n=1 Tax=Wenjunlia tyrosinilytica TaxID=1544741 RepID=A0A917ZVQ9_9ACTN|nr:hypothetical protein GCM10012280_49020 [Wenjunlia tyrosinilytica]